MRIGMVGCGYVASLCMETLPLHPELDLVAVHDKDPERSRQFAAHYAAIARGSLEARRRADPRDPLRPREPPARGAALVLRTPRSDAPGPVSR